MILKITIICMYLNALKMVLISILSQRIELSL